MRSKTSNWLLPSVGNIIFNPRAFPILALVAFYLLQFAGLVFGSNNSILKRLLGHDNTVSSKKPRTFNDASEQLNDADPQCLDGNFSSRVSLPDIGFFGLSPFQNMCSDGLGQDHQSSYVPNYSDFMEPKDHISNNLTKSQNIPSSAVVSCPERGSIRNCPKYYKSSSATLASHQPQKTAKSGQTASTSLSSSLQITEQQIASNELLDILFKDPSKFKQDQFVLFQEIELRLDKSALDELQQQFNSEQLESRTEGNSTDDPSNLSDTLQANNKYDLPQHKQQNSIVEYSHGIISFNDRDVQAGSPKSYCTSYQNKRVNFHFNSNTLDGLLIFRYAIGTFSLLQKNEDNLKKEFGPMVMHGIQAIISTVMALDPQTRPFYYIFGGYAGKTKQSKSCRKVPLYFLFTSISYSMQTGKMKRDEFLGTLIKSAYQRATLGGHLKGLNWDFLKTHLQDILATSKATLIPQTENVDYDISIILFIYNEMKCSPDEKVRTFFTEIWNTCKANFDRKLSVHLCDDPELTIPDMYEVKDTIEQAVRKLYQLKFTELLFGENSLKNLLVKYSKLKADFNTNIRDFSSRIFNRNDFILLKSAVENICSALKEFTDAEIFEARCFLIELGYYVKFKSILFTYDFFAELKLKKDFIGAPHCATFEDINSINSTFTEIQNILLSKNIGFNVFKLYEVITKGKGNYFCLETVLCQIGQIITPQFVGSDKKTIILNVLDICFKNFAYLDRNLDYLPSNLSRFEYAEFVAQLEDIVASNEEQRTNEIFSNNKYKDFRALWRYNPEKLNSLSFQDKRRYLECFKTYLILYNQ